MPCPSSGEGCVQGVGMSRGEVGMFKGADTHLSPTGHGARGGGFPSIADI